MGLFKKENCCICGGKTGLLDKKCADGKVCKECTKKLSTWFDEYKTSTKTDLENQLNQKETDLKNISNYDFSQVFGEFGVILIDPKERVFSAIGDTSNGLFGSQRKVKSIDDVMDFRPDIISFDMVKDIDIDVVETTREEKFTENGEQKSYFPPRFLYMYMFYLRLHIDHPYVKFINIQLNDNAVQIKNVGRRKWTDPGRKLAAHLLGLPGLIEEEKAAVYDNESLLQCLYHSKYEMPDYSYGFKCTRANWDDIQKYYYFLAMAREIKETILPD